MIRITDKKNCCGCEACVQKCPKHCITMRVDSEGFLYPNVDEPLCINCGLCEKVCPEINNNPSRDPFQVFAAQANENEILQKSSSGGIFTLLATKILNKKGVVFGAIFDKNWSVIHSYTENVSELDSFRRSKYLQSKIGNTYKQVEKFLKLGNIVLFTGTPCQVKGLKLYLGKEYNNLLTVDFICHGVPSPAVWQMYLKAYVESVGENVSSIDYINFRDKKSGWKNYSLSIDFQNSTISEVYSRNLYMKLFLSDIILRPACYSCKAKNGQSNSDITIGDFWGIEKVFPDCIDDKGYSLVLVNTEKGETFLREINTVVHKEVPFSIVKPFNGGLHANISTPQNRAKFFSKFAKTTDRKILSLMKKATRLPLNIRIKFKLRQLVKRIFKK